MKPLIVALDLETDKEALQMAKRLSAQVDVFKVGPVLFLKYGAPLIRDLRALGAQVFLDMKFHDIPSVVQKAIERAGEMGVYSATLHTSGGMEMMRQAAHLKKRPKLWGVTVLTSLAQNDIENLGFTVRNLSDQVSHMAKMAMDAGLEGVVASVQEASEIRRITTSNFDIVTPGIRLADARDDQKRVQTPAEAIQKGATYFVVGRPITEAKDPIKAVKTIYDSLTPSLSQEERERG